MELGRATLAERLFTLETIDWGFVRPRRPGDRLLAYAQSQWMCEYLVERFGYDILHNMLVAYRDGKTQQQAFAELTGHTTEEFDQAFRAWATGQVASWNLPIGKPITTEAAKAKLSPDPTPAELADLALAQLHARKTREAEDSARVALEKDPDNVAALGVLGLIACMRLDDDNAPGDKAGHKAQAVAYLTRVAKLDPNNAAAPKLLGQVALEYGTEDEAIQWLNRLKAVCPRDPAGYRGLAGIYLDREQPDKALPEMLHLARTRDDDIKLPIHVADIYEQKGEPQQARFWLLQANHLDPFNDTVRARLAALCLELDDHDEAIFQYRMAAALSPEKAPHFAGLADAYRKAGKTGKARDAERTAAKLRARAGTGN